MSWRRWLLLGDPERVTWAGIAVEALVWPVLAFVVWTPLVMGPTDMAILSDRLYALHLALHEIGHLVFAPLGAWMGQAGGTLGQLIPPAFAVLWSIRIGLPYAAGASLVVTGHSLASCAPYISDARALQMPLVAPWGFGRPADKADVHDWHVLLDSVGLLAWDHALGWAALLLAKAMVVGGWAWAAAALGTGVMHRLQGADRP